MVLDRYTGQDTQFKYMRSPPHLLIVKLKQVPNDFPDFPDFFHFEVSWQLYLIPH